MMRIIQRCWAIALVVGAAILGSSTAIAQQAAEPVVERESMSREEYRAARRVARFRRRRIIVNNDGNDKAKPPYTPEDFLASRTSALTDAQVDSIFYCTGVPMHYTHRSRIAEQMGVGDHADVPGKGWVAAFNEMDTDSLEIVVDWCKQNDREVFWSMRMNDRHDSSSRWEYLVTDWKRENPQLLMGTEEGGLPKDFERGAKSWSMMRYDQPEVRDRVFQVIEEVCCNYDVDGIELDFFRHPAFFTEPLKGQPTPQEKLDMMTGLLRRINSMATQVGMERGRPLLIAIRIPDSMDYCKAMGLDVPKWLEEGLVDIVTGAGYFKLEPWENLVATGKKYDVPVYACFAIRRIEANRNPESKADIRVWRGEAYNAWQAGVDGIYLMNRFNPKDPMLQELGDPKKLAKLERTTGTAYYNPKLWSKPQTWVPEGLLYLKDLDAPQLSD
ncbi:glycoside hydrolase family 10 protein [Adhaeretor mobilis]|uniref:Glycosyl hydrolase-like 10 domain-containing protein n=1 Tax=Adhaeretor mobilis TaxID=1930276 RepID=A0A517MVF5_9BACT|nr:hypothetical protein [Adhaeretor mobilis]QDS98859.1 hypothetical protein HG15A2_21450 [Adhaeretor mobilis]